MVMEVTYQIGPRFIDGKNIDEDVKAAIPRVIVEQDIDSPVTGIEGLGYNPGQRNRDGSEL
jgi:hypothetical protein